jgi:hypothetical protein
MSIINTLPALHNFGERPRPPTDFTESVMVNVLSNVTLLTPVNL